MNQRIDAIAPPSNPAERETISEAVVDAVSEATDRSPVDLEPLASVIDPDALESLVSSMSSLPDEPTSQIQFGYCGRTVTVREDGTVRLTELAD